MRSFGIVLILFVAACSQDPGDDSNGRNNANNESNSPNNTADVSTDDSSNRDTDRVSDLGDRTPDADSLDTGGTEDMGTNQDAETDTGSSDDMSMNADVGDGCIDDDGDGFYVMCRDFTGVPGPDCDDADPDNWQACGRCVDRDNDNHFVNCDAYVNRMGPDCDDNDNDNWVSCGFCTDQDGDQYFDDCDAYNTRMGRDCNDSDADNWTSCNTCVDGDGDGYWVQCDQYRSIQGPDCNDGDADINPGETEVPNNGADDDCDPSTPDVMCGYVPIPATNPEPGLMAGMTAEHNRWRVRVGVAPLQWNATLAASATAYVSQCIWGHDQNRSPDAGFNYVGENIYFSGGQPTSGSILNAVNLWAGERVDYDYGDVIQNGGPTVGHYTQIVWDDSTDVGCGYAYCQNIQGLSRGGTLVACRYGPGGNYLGQTPYDYSAGACLDLDNDDVWQGNDPDDTDRSVP